MKTQRRKFKMKHNKTKNKKYFGGKKAKKKPQKLWFRIPGTKAFVA